MLKRTGICFLLALIFVCAGCAREEVEVPPAATPTPETITIKPGDVDAFLRGENKELMEALNGQR